MTDWVFRNSLDCFPVIYQLHLLSTWGDPYYVGLNGIEIYDAQGNQVPLDENSMYHRWLCVCDIINEETSAWRHTVQQTGHYFWRQQVQMISQEGNMFISMFRFYSNNKSESIQVMGWCHQATSHNLNQWWLSSLTPYGIIQGWRINSLWPSDTIWRQRSASTLAQVMACCLTAPSHYLNQCWLIIS